MKPKKLIKSCELSSLDGVKEISFGKASVEARMRRDFSKKEKTNTSREYADETARAKRYGL